VTVGVWLGVQVGQRVSEGKGVWLGTGVLVEVCTGVKVRVGGTVGAVVPVQASVFVRVSDETVVAVHSGMAAGVERVTGRVIFPVKRRTTQTILKAIKINARPKYRRLDAIRLPRSGQLAWRRLLCKECRPARKLKKAPSKPMAMAMMRLV
jgi:hypothetical protein